MSEKEKNSGTSTLAEADLRKEVELKSVDLNYFEIWLVLLTLIDIKSCCVAFILVSVVLIAYYVYLNNLYMIDVTMEVPIMRVLHQEEKVTVRVDGGDCGSTTTKEFIKRYSACESVSVIQILCNSHSSTKAIDSIKENYRTTLIPANQVSGLYSIYLAHSSHSPVSTRGVLFLEVDQIVSCPDIDFLHTTWRSSQHSFTGLFPRLLTKTVSSNKASMDSKSTSFSVLGSFWIWWTRAYSLMLPTGVIINRDQLWKDADTGDAGDKSFRDALSKNPSCFPVSLYLHAMLFPSMERSPSHLNGAVSGSSSSSSSSSSVVTRIGSSTMEVKYSLNSKIFTTPPIWVDVSSSTPAVLYQENWSNDHLSKCVNILMDSLNDESKRLDLIPEYSHHKAARAKQRWLW